MALRLTDAIILPLNTTQYVLELHQYLDRWVLVTFYSYSLVLIVTVD